MFTDYHADAKKTAVAFFGGNWKIKDSSVITLEHTFPFCRHRNGDEGRFLRFDLLQKYLARREETYYNQNVMKPPRDRSPYFISSLQNFSARLFNENLFGEMSNKNLK